MLESQLTITGLTLAEAQVYEVLLDFPYLAAGRIIQMTDLKRGTVYNVLESLKIKGLVEELTEFKVARFKAKHPAHIHELIDQKEGELKGLRQNLSGLIERYSLTNLRPGVRTYDGISGMKKVLDDTLTSKTEILTYVDSDAVEKYTKTVNAEYVDKRLKAGVTKRIIALDTPFARAHFLKADSELTKVRFMPRQFDAFHRTGAQIYDGKVAYTTLTDQNIIGVIIEDKNIYEMHKALFGFNWNQLA